jgi:hypothetical protein
MLFKSPDGAFRDGTAVTVGWDQFVLHIIGGGEILQSGQCLVVESLELRSETLDSEFLMDVIIMVLI